jgi:acyl-CoA thioester hydrolase
LNDCDIVASQSFKTSATLRATMASCLPPRSAMKGSSMKPVLHPPPVLTYRGFSGARDGAASQHALLARYEEATWQLLARLGYGPRRMANERRGLMALEQRIVHLEELRADTVLHIESDLLELGATRLRCLHRMCDSESQRTLSTMELTFVLTGADEGSSTAPPPELVQRALAVFPQVPRSGAEPASVPRERAALPV